MFIITLTYTRPLEEVDPLLDAHIAWLKEGYAAGLCIASGRKVPRDGGVLLSKAGSRQQLDAWLARDPFALGMVARYDVTEFTPSMTALGFECLKPA